MNDIECLAKRIILIGKGTILYDGTLNKLKKTYGNHKIINVFTNDKIHKLTKKGIVKQTASKNGYEFIIDSNIISISIFLKYLSTKMEIDDIEIENESIDNIIIKLYRDYEI